MASTFFIETHGCQMNAHDSEKICGLLAHRGMIAVDNLDEADLYLINTCSVREKAAHRVYSRLGKLKDRRARDPNFIIAVVGCVAQQESEEMVNNVPHVDLVVGTHLYHSIPDLLDQIESERQNYSESTPRISTQFLPERVPVEIEQVVRSSSFRANITIMEGCNKHCAFCIVPHTRGRERNRPASNILDEARQVAADGFVEIQLLGQTVNSYRDPDNPRFKFADLLQSVARIKGIQRIRFTSPHPRHFDDRVISVIADNENICPSVHIPVQSGSTKILKRMRRQHDREWYLQLVEKFRSCGRSIAFSTDMIVGFPGETDQDFEETLSLVKAVEYEQMFSFKYSPRPFTEALEWEDDIPESVKADRLTILQQLQRDTQLRLHEELYLNRSFEVLTEGTAKDGVNRYGRTSSNKVVNFPGEERPGSFVRVRIEEIGPNSLFGQSKQPRQLVNIA